MGATERVKEFIEYKEVSKYKFCKELGFSNKFLDNSSNMGTDKACKILHHYPELNAEWLLTGRGDMIQNTTGYINESKSHNPLFEEGGKHLISPSEEEQVLNNVYKLKTDNIIDDQLIPLYNLEATAGIVELFQNSSKAIPVDTIKIPNLPKSDGALFVTGDSMYPLLKSGDIVIYKEIYDKINDIFWGEMYLVSINVAGEEYVSIKYIQQSNKGEEYIKLVSQNSHHQPKDVHIDKIYAIALVKASIRVNAMG